MKPEISLIISVIIAFIGWIIAIYNLNKIKKNNERDFLEKTLSFFDEGKNTRSIATTYINNVWLKKRKYDGIIVPVLISQLKKLLNKDETIKNYYDDIIEILKLLYKYIQISDNLKNESELIFNVILNRIIKDYPNNSHSYNKPISIDYNDTQKDHKLFIWLKRFKSHVPDKYIQLIRSKRI